MFAVISDIHANFEALKTVLNYLKKIHVEKIYCLGDLIGYGPEPEKVIQEIQKREIPTCVGNHEAALLEPELAFNFNPAAKESIRLTKPEISQNSIDYLKMLKMSYNAENCLFVHSSPFNPKEWDYIYYPGQAAPVFKHYKESVCFIGHTHSPVVLSNDGQCDFSSEVSLSAQKKYLINILLRKKT